MGKNMHHGRVQKLLRISAAAQFLHSAFHRSSYTYAGSTRVNGVPNQGHSQRQSGHPPTPEHRLLAADRSWRRRDLEQDP